MTTTTGTPPPGADTAQLIDVGTAFVEALQRRDFDAMAGCLASDVRFRALLPPREIDTIGPDAVLAEFRGWLGPPDEKCEVVDVAVDSFGPRLHMRWRFLVTPEGGAARVAEQHAYANGSDTFTKLSILCSGFVPA
jgi:hypothetical protein